MKYIRTKDGIFYKELSKIGNSCGLCPEPDYICQKCGEHIIKQADTIEELCDGFRKIEQGTDVNGKPWVGREFCWIKHKQIPYIGTEDEFGYYHEFPYTQYIRNDINFSVEIYGYIETDKGLIYVAKMNSKGELELL